MHVLLAYSGGLDTSYLVAWLHHDQGHEVTAVTVDCGGFSDDEKQALQSRALALGACEHRFIDARQALFDRVLKWLIAGNVLRGSVYPISVGAERGLQAEALAELAQREGFEALAHGCTGAGNDQVRFEAALHTLAPDLKVMAPVRDLAPTRQAQFDFLQQAGFPVPPTGSRYSINAGLWGLTIGGGEMLETRDPLPEEAWQWTRGATGSSEIELSFETGVPTGLDGKRLDTVSLIEGLNRLGGQHGVGRGYHLGDTVLGIKGRIAFEAPAAAILIHAHQELEKLVLTEDQRFWKDHLAEVYGRRLHQGLLHDPLMRDIEAMLASSQNRVTGTVRLLLSHGQALVTGLDSPFSLLCASDARYGERPSTEQDPQGAAWLARTLSEPARLHRLAGQQANSQPVHEQEEVCS